MIKSFDRNADSAACTCNEISTSLYQEFSHQERRECDADRDPATRPQKATVLQCLMVGLISLGWCAQEALSAPAPASVHAEKGADWKPLFDGKSLKGWKVTDFAGHGEVTVEPKFRAGTNFASPVILFEMGAALTGITWTNPAPSGEYEVSLEAMKVDGSDFFCALTFPAGGGHCSLIVGGWGGGVVGISSVDGMDASENETTKFRSFEKNRWYRIRLRATQRKIEAWIDDEKVVDLGTTDRRMSVRAGEIELNEPFGLSSYQTRAAFRNLKLRQL